MSVGEQAADVLVDNMETGNEELETDKPPSEIDQSGQVVTDGEIEDLLRKVLTVSGTSFAFAGIMMGWLNTCLTKSLPVIDEKHAKRELYENDGSLNRASLSTTFEISPENLQVTFISLGSSAIGVFLGVAFIAYQVSLVLREIKNFPGSETAKRFKSMLMWSKCCHIFLCCGVFLGFLSLAFSVLLIHNFSIRPFLCFLVPLIVSTAFAVLAFLKL